ncbi:hypothetical protein [Dyella sp. GSA-30]|uniref:hypothetical protein n=1 Tax=Dyella sp. GSA-30 TaxID=2994496 RepID=UPI002490E88E|nr:hypothetical protein [Dyella sp. GSA-30]BDU22024.1 hypothetical protein DYGSA30_34810 [Dyella sp. GSA-30]
MNVRKRESRRIAVVLLLSLLVSCSDWHEADSTAKTPTYDDDARAGWTQFIELAKTKDKVISEQLLRQRYGQDVRKRDYGDRSYGIVVDYTKPEGHGFHIGLSYLARPVAQKDYSHPLSDLAVFLPSNGCLNRDAARSDLAAIGFVFTRTVAFSGLIDEYQKEGRGVSLELRTAVRARTIVQEMKYGPRPAVICVQTATLSSIARAVVPLD